VEGQVPLFISSRNRVARLYTRHLVPFSSPPTTRRATVEVFEPASTRGCSTFLSESYVTIDGQSASLSWNKAPIWGLRPDFYYCQTVAVLLLWGALSDERTGLSFTTAAESESYVTTDGQPASLSWSKAPIWGLRPDPYYMCDSYGLVLVGRPL
jgi:hypothetical protein